MPEALSNEDVFEIRGRLAVLDRDAARLFGVTASAMNQAVSRNKGKFSETYSFRLTPAETQTVRSHFVTSDPGKVARLRTPRVFTEEGIIMLATVLKSERAVAATRQVVRTFVAVQRQLREGRNQDVSDPLPDAPAIAATSRAAALPMPVSRKLERLIDHLADITMTPDQQDAVIAEAKRFWDEALESLHALVKKPELAAGKTTAEIQKLLAEAAKLNAETQSILADAQEKKRLALIRDLRFFIACQTALTQGDLDAFGRTLDALDRP